MVAWQDHSPCRNAAQFLGIQEVQWILDQLGTEYPTLVGELLAALGAREYEEAVDAASLAGLVAGWGERLRPHIVDTTDLVQRALARGERESPPFVSSERLFEFTGRNVGPVTVPPLPSDRHESEAAPYGAITLSGGWSGAASR